MGGENPLQKMQKWNYVTMTKLLHPCVAILGRRFTVTMPLWAGLPLMHVMQNQISCLMDDANWLSSHMHWHISPNIRQQLFQISRKKIFGTRARLTAWPSFSSAYKQSGSALKRSSDLHNSRPSAFLNSIHSAMPYVRFWSIFYGGTNLWT